MAKFEEFKFQRSRGVVWVADIAGSTKYLNDNQHIGMLEDYIPRLHWLSLLVVTAAGGRFVKWTGDGFLAWFETPLHRELAAVANAVFMAAWNISLISNVTQLGLNPTRKFRIRHGITFEQDALVMRITHPNGTRSLDLVGRNVTLAFRVCSTTAPFPSIVTQRELAAVAAKGFRFKHWRVSADELLRYFKGETWATKSLFMSAEERPSPRRSIKGVVRQAKMALSRAESGLRDGGPNASLRPIVEGMLSGPDWAQEVAGELARYVEEDLFGALRSILPVLEDAAKQEKPLQGG